VSYVELIQQDNWIKEDPLCFIDLLASISDSQSAQMTDLPTTADYIKTKDDARMTGASTGRVKKKKKKKKSYAFVDLKFHIVVVAVSTGQLPCSEPVNTSIYCGVARLGERCRLDATCRPITHLQKI